MQHLTKSFVSNLEAFQRSYFTDTRQAIAECGRLIVAMLEENENAFEIIAAQCPGVSLGTLQAFELVGRGKLHPLLLADPSPAARRAIGQALSIEEQNQLVESCVPVAKFTDDGAVRVEQKRLPELSARESARIIKDHILTVEEQVDEIKAEIAAKAVRSLRYKIDPEHSRVTFYEQTTLTWAELTEICDQILAKAIDIESAVKANQIS